MPKTTAALARATVFLLFVALLLCVWTRSPPGIAERSLAQGIESTAHAQGAEEGESPRPVAEQELALKKRRNQPGQTLYMQASLDAGASQSIVKTFPSDGNTRLRLDYATQRARECYGFACHLQLSDPALRLHPGHAPPQQSGIAG